MYVPRIFGFIKKYLHSLLLWQASHNNDKRRNSMNTTYTLSSTSTLEPVMDELTLVRLSQQGDREMFAHLYEGCVERIHRYVSYRVDDEKLAEDITSQIFLKVWEKLDTYQVGQSPFLAWVYRIARNTLIDHYRTRKVAISLEDASPVELSHADGVDEKLDLQTQSRELHEALQELTKKQRQVLILKFIHGFSTLEIARRLDKQEGTIRALQMRGLQGLAKCPALQREQIYEQ
jgi:RNA polymerase sigma-70 factor, ECF subfamily